MIGFWHNAVPGFTHRPGMSGPRAGRLARFTARIRDLSNAYWPEVPRVNSVEEKLELVAAGAGICVIPLSTAAFYTRQDVIGIPVEDIGPNQVCLAWLAARRSSLIDAFVDAAASLVP
ncbi:LysR substrate binding domain-containing protein [Lentzea fradiae]|uniref:LysR substrate binding domain-containing protein n=1 Tax=Lentzea fradiae TaxID=200378 RepID=A0A1G7XIJ7_9PSEU|nr:LysR substrate-binding domain-containing protein [Lentzea fradiae]SDG84075.1 LysR substrate binding domain-containing protein [Lentzea fradiae]